MAGADLFDYIAADEDGAVGDFAAAVVHRDNDDGVLDQQGFAHGFIQLPGWWLKMT
jgi:hypothetical protein